MPHASTYRRVMQQGVDVTQLEQEAREVCVHDEPGSERTAQSGRQNFPWNNSDRRNRRGHLLAVQEVTKNLVLAHIEVGVKENEIRAAPHACSVRFIGRQGRQRRCDADPAGAFRADRRAWWSVCFDSQRESANIRMDIETLFMSQGTPDTATETAYCSDTR